MNLHEPINDFQIWSGANTPVSRDATAKGNTNYFEEQQYQLKVTSSVNVSDMSLHDTVVELLCRDICEVVNWKIGSFPEITRNLSISGALPALMALVYVL